MNSENETDNSLFNQNENNISSFNSVELQKANIFSKSISKIKVTNKDILYEQKERKRIKKFKLSLLFIIIGLALIFSGFALNKSKLLYSNKGKRTIMIYMIGSDLESKYLAGTNDINEIIDSNIDFDDNNIIIYTGGAKVWHTENIDSNKHSLIELNKNGIKKLEEFDNNNMLDYKNLSYLLNYGYENYDTEYYDLILWDHGAGPIYGYGYDEYNKNSSMSIIDIKNALFESPFTKKNKLELIGFDACLMSSIEVASSLSNFSEYMVSSQEFEPGAGWDYSFLERVNSKTSSLELGKLIIDYFNDFYSSKNYTKGYSLSLLKLNKIENVKENTDSLFEKIEENIDIDFSSISRTRSSSKSFGRIKNEEYYYDLVDFNDLLNNLPENYEKEVNNLKGSLTDFIVYQKTDLMNTNGVSIYFPYENKNGFSKNIDDYKKLNFSEEYNNFLNLFVGNLTNERINNWNLENIKLEIIDDKIIVDLPQDILNNYSKIEYVIFEKKGSYYSPIFSGSDVTVKDNKLSTKIEKKAIVVNNNGEKFTTTAIESINGINYKAYLIPATVTRVNKDNFSIDVLGVYLEFVIDDDNPQGYISSIYPIELNENLTYSKVSIDLKDWDSLSLLGYKYKIMDDQGNYTSNWISSKEVDTFTINDLDDININLEDIDISKDYYCLLKIKDSQGYTYYTNIIGLK